jgi:hypothetical protein
MDYVSKQNCSTTIPNVWVNKTSCMQVTLWQSKLLGDIFFQTGKAPTSASK